MSCPEARTTDAGGPVAGARMRLGEACRFSSPPQGRESRPISLAPMEVTFVAGARLARRVCRQRGGHQRRPCTCRLSCVLCN
jgi:hypothetical protein